MILKDFLLHRTSSNSPQSINDEIIQLKPSSPKTTTTTTTRRESIDGSDDLVTPSSPTPSSSSSSHSSFISNTSSSNLSASPPPLQPVKVSLHPDSLNKTTRAQAQQQRHSNPDDTLNLNETTTFASQFESTQTKEAVNFNMEQQEEETIYQTSANLIYDNKNELNEATNLVEAVAVFLNDQNQDEDATNSYCLDDDYYEIPGIPPLDNKATIHQTLIRTNNDEEYVEEEEEDDTGNISTSLNSNMNIYAYQSSHRNNNNNNTLATNTDADSSCWSHAEGNISIFFLKDIRTSEILGSYNKMYIEFEPGNKNNSGLSKSERIDFLAEFIQFFEKSNFKFFC